MFLFSLCSDALKNKIRNQNKKINENIFKDKQFENDYLYSVSSSEFENEFMIEPNFQFDFYNIDELNN